MRTARVGLLVTLNWGAKAGKSSIKENHADHIKWDHIDNINTATFITALPYYVIYKCTSN